MSKVRLLAMAAAVGALGAGGALFFNWEEAKVEQTIADTGSWEQVDRASCSASACNTAQCSTALDHLTDAGSSCIGRFVECDFRVSQRMRSCFADAGIAIGVAKYQRVRLIALRCPGVDGGQAFGVPFDDAGCPIFAEAVVTPLCVRAPLDGGTDCRKAGGELDGGPRFIGTGNVFAASAAQGTQCEPVGCSVFFGDSDLDL